MKGQVLLLPVSQILRGDDRADHERQVDPNWRSSKRGRRHFRLAHNTVELPFSKISFHFCDNNI